MAQVPNLNLQKYANSTILIFWYFDSLTTKKQMTKYSSANFQKMLKSKLYHIEKSKTRWQTG